MLILLLLQLAVCKPGKPRITSQNTQSTSSSSGKLPGLVQSQGSDNSASSGNTGSWFNFRPQRFQSSTKPIKEESDDGSFFSAHSQESSPSTNGAGKVAQKDDSWDAWFRSLMPSSDESTAVPVPAAKSVEQPAQRPQGMNGPQPLRIQRPSNTQTMGTTPSKQSQSTVRPPLALLEDGTFGCLDCGGSVGCVCQTLTNCCCCPCLTLEVYRECKNAAREFFSG